MPPRVPLAVGVSTGTKVGFSVLGVFIALASLGFAALGFGLAFGGREAINSTGIDGPYHVDDNDNVVPGALETGEFTGGVLGAAGIGFMFCGGLALLLALFIVLRVARSAAWLEGSRLFVRGALRTKSADLATSALSAGSATQAVGAGEARTLVAVHSLTAVDPQTNARVTIALRRGGATILPSDQLSMLANAITNARTKQGDDDLAFVIAGRLRDFANDPFS